MLLGFRKKAQFLHVFPFLTLMLLFIFASAHANKVLFELWMQAQKETRQTVIYMPFLANVGVGLHLLLLIMVS